MKRGEMSLTAWPSLPWETGKMRCFSISPSPLPLSATGEGIWLGGGSGIGKTPGARESVLWRRREAALLSAIGDFRTAYETGPFGPAMKVRQECDNTGW